MPFGLSTMKQEVRFVNIPVNNQYLYSSEAVGGYQTATLNNVCVDYPNQIPNSLISSSQVDNLQVPIDKLQSVTNYASFNPPDILNPNASQLTTDENQLSMLNFKQMPEINYYSTNFNSPDTILNTNAYIFTSPFATGHNQLGVLNLKQIPEMNSYSGNFNPSYILGTNPGIVTTPQLTTGQNPVSVENINQIPENNCYSVDFNPSDTILNTNYNSVTSQLTTEETPLSVENIKQIREINSYSATNCDFVTSQLTTIKNSGVSLQQIPAEIKSVIKLKAKNNLENQPEKVCFGSGVNKKRAPKKYDVKVSNNATQLHDDNAKGTRQHSEPLIIGNSRLLKINKIGKAEQGTQTEVRCSFKDDDRLYIVDNSSPESEITVTVDNLSEAGDDCLRSPASSVYSNLRGNVLLEGNKTVRSKSIFGDILDETLGIGPSPSQRITSVSQTGSTVQDQSTMGMAQSPSQQMTFESETGSTVQSQLTNASSESNLSTNSQHGNVWTTSNCMNVPTSGEPVSHFFNKMYQEIKCCLIEDKDGHIPLHQAVINNDLSRLRSQCIVLKFVGSHMNHLNIMQETALMLAVKLAIMDPTRNEIVSALLKEGADQWIVDQDGFTALHHAVKHGCKLLVDILLANRRSLQVKEKFGPDGFAPLHLAAIGGYNDIIRSLMKKKVDVNIKDRKSGRTPYFLAVEMGHPRTVRLLVKFKANTTEPNFAGQLLPISRTIRPPQRITEQFNNSEDEDCPDEVCPSSNEENSGVTSEIGKSNSSELNYSHKPVSCGQQLEPFSAQDIISFDLNLENQFIISSNSQTDISPIQNNFNTSDCSSNNVLEGSGDPPLVISIPPATSNNDASQNKSTHNNLNTSNRTSVANRKNVHKRPRQPKIEKETKSPNVNKTVEISQGEFTAFKKPRALPKVNRKSIMLNSPVCASKSSLLSGPEENEDRSKTKRSSDETNLTLTKPTKISRSYPLSKLFFAVQNNSLNLGNELTNSIRHKNSENQGAQFPLNRNENCGQIAEIQGNNVLNKSFQVDKSQPEALLKSKLQISKTNNNHSSDDFNKEQTVTKDHARQPSLTAIENVHTNNSEPSIINGDSENIQELNGKDDSYVPNFGRGSKNTTEEHNVINTSVEHTRRRQVVDKNMASRDRPTRKKSANSGKSNETKSPLQSHSRSRRPRGPGKTETDSSSVEEVQKKRKRVK